MAHTRQSKPDAGLVFQMKAGKSFKFFSLRSEAGRLIHDQQERMAVLYTINTMA